MDDRINQLEARLMVLEAWIGSAIGADPLLSSKFTHWADTVTTGAGAIVDPTVRAHLLKHLDQWKHNIEAGQTQPGISLGPDRVRQH